MTKREWLQKNIDALVAEVKQTVDESVESGEYHMFVLNPDLLDRHVMAISVELLTAGTRWGEYIKEEYEAKRAIKDAEGEATERLTEAYQRNTGRKPTVAQLEAVVALDKNVQEAHKKYAKVLYKLHTFKTIYETLERKAVLIPGQQGATNALRKM